MNEKIKLICFITVCAVAIFITGCRTVPVADTGSLEHQRRIATLEARIVDYERRIAEYDSLIGGTVERLEAIRSRANSITDRIDRIIFLFEEYDREVNRLIDSLNTGGGTTSQVATDELLALVRYYRNVGIEAGADYFRVCQTSG
jgi:hypothetical protein